MSTFGPSPAQPIPPAQEQSHRVGATEPDRKHKRAKEDEARKRKAAADSVEITGPHQEAEEKPAAPPKDEGDERAHIDVQG